MTGWTDPKDCTGTAMMELGRTSVPEPAQADVLPSSGPGFPAAAGNGGGSDIRFKQCSAMFWGGNGSLPAVVVYEHICFTLENVTDRGSIYNWQSTGNPHTGVRHQLFGRRPKHSLLAIPLPTNIH